MFFSFLFCALLFGLLVHLAFQYVITDPLFSSTPAPLNPLLDLNLNMKLNPKTTVHDDIYKIKSRLPDTLYNQYLNPISK